MCRHVEAMLRNSNSEKSELLKNFRVGITNWRAVHVDLFLLGNQKFLIIHTVVNVALKFGKTAAGDYQSLTSAWLFHIEVRLQILTASVFENVVSSQSQRASDIHTPTYSALHENIWVYSIWAGEEKSSCRCRTRCVLNVFSQIQLYILNIFKYIFLLCVHVQMTFFFLNWRHVQKEICLCWESLFLPWFNHF